MILITPPAVDDHLPSRESGPLRPDSRLSGLRRELRNPLLRNGHLLTLSSTLTAVVGLAYWATAARRYDVTVIGTNSAAITLMTLAAFIAQLNLSSAMVRFVPSAGRHTMRLVAGAYIVSGCLAVAVGAVFAVVITTITPQAGFITGTGPLIMFVGTTVLYTLFTIQDGVLVGLRQAWLVPVENFLFAIAKLALVFGLAAAMPWHGIFTSWSLALAVAVVAVGGFLFIRAIPRQSGAEMAHTLPPPRQVARFVVFDYIGAACGMASSSLLPVLVIAVLGAKENAYFSIAWVVSYSLHLVGTNMGISMVAETAKRPAELPDSVRRVLAHTGKILLPAVAALIAFAPWFLTIFGTGYAAAGSTLRLLVIAAIPNLIVTVAISSARVQSRLAPLIALQAAQLLLVAALGWPLIRLFGIEGAALTWLAAQVVLATVLLVRRGWWLSSSPRAPQDGPPRSWGRVPYPIAEGLVGVLRALTVLRIRDLTGFLAARLEPRRGNEMPLADLLVASGAPFDDLRLGGWTTARRVNNRMDLTVALLGRGRETPSGVLKLARSPEGGGELRAQGDTLTGFARDPRLAEWRTILPEVLVSPDASEASLTVESYKAGKDLAELLARHPDRTEELTALAVSAISELHSRTGTMVDVDERHLQEWVHRPLNALRENCRLLSPGLLPAVDRAEALLGESLSGGRVLSGWAHRDFTPENVRLAGPVGPVTGIVDWGGARPDQPSVLDGYLLVLCASRLVEKRQFGDIVARRLQSGGLVPRERNALRAAGPACYGTTTDQSAILLVWLHYLAETWRKSTVYQRDRVWWAANVAPVLRMLGRPAHAAPGRHRRPPTSGVLALAGAVLLWASSLPRVRLDAMGDYGLVALLPLTYWAALVLLVVSFATLVRRGAGQPLLLSAHVLSLVAFLHATPSLLYPALRYSWAWKHIGVVDFFIRHHAVDTSVRELSAYQNWPGFFTFNATLTESAGWTSAAGYAPWAPLFFGVLMLGPIYLIFQRLTGDPRLVWTGMVIYVLGAWVGQDYFAPQAVAFFLYLTVIAICLRHRAPGRPGRFDRSYGAILILMVAAIAPTHQLTPLMLIAGLVALAICRYRVRILLLAAAAFALGWDVLFAWPWIAENLASIGSSFGTIGSNATSVFINLSDASRSQAVIAYLDRGLTAAIGVLAILGFLRRFRQHRQPVAVLLAVAPLPMVLMNDYGGEIIFRVYLFGLPFLAFYAAAAFFPTPASGRSRYTMVVLAAVLVALIPGFIFAYFGKESENYFSRDELAVSKFLFGTAPRGSLIVGATTDFPWAYVNYEFYDYFRFAELEPKDRLAFLSNPVGRLDDAMNTHHHAFLVVTRSQIAQLEMVGALPHGGITRMVEQLEASPRFTVVFRNPGGVVLTLAQPRPGYTS